MGLSQLWELQEIQLRCQELQHRLQVSTLARELKKEKERLEAFRETINTRIREREQILQENAGREKACRDLEARKKQLEDKLYSGETNSPKELKNLQQQLETVAGELAGAEEKSLELAMQREQLEAELAADNSQFQAERDAYREKLGQYRTWREGLQQEIDVLMANATQLEEEIEPPLRTLYSDLQRRLGIKALARVVKGTCSGCNLFIPPVLLRDIRSSKTVYCESCGRLLLP